MEIQLYLERNGGEAEGSPGHIPEGLAHSDCPRSSVSSAPWLRETRNSHRYNVTQPGSRNDAIPHQ